MIGLFIQKSHFHPYSIHSWFANGKTFCLLCLQVKIRKLTRDQLSSLVRFKTTSLNWISLVMKVDPSLTFLIFLVSTTTKYFPVCVPLVSYCDGLKSTICWKHKNCKSNTTWDGTLRPLLFFARFPIFLVKGHHRMRKNYRSLFKGAEIIQEGSSSMFKRFDPYLGVIFD